MTEITDPTEIVAKAMHEHLRDEDEPEFADLPADERAGLMGVALIAMETHFDWLKAQGFRIAPPGAMLRPQSDGDAKAMILVGKEFLDRPEHARQRRKSLVSGPKRILPSRLQ